MRLHGADVLDKKMVRYIKTHLLRRADGQPFHFLNQSVPVLMGIFIFFNPFPHTTSIKETCFYLSVFIVLVLLLLKKIDVSYKTPLLLPFGLFVFWAFIGLFFALDKENSIHDFRSHLLRYIVLYYMLTNYFVSKKGIVTLSWVIVISTTLASVGGLWFHYVTMEHNLSTRFGSGPDFSEIPVNQIGILTIFAIILCLNHYRTSNSFWQKTGVLLLACPLVVTTFLTQARSSIVAMYLSILVSLVRNKKMLAGFLLVFPIVVSVTPAGKRFLFDITENIRLRQHLLTLEVVKDYPLTGIGFGMKRYDFIVDLNAYKKKLPEKYQRQEHMGIPHGMLMNIAVRVGIVGLVLFLWIIFVVFKMCWASMTHGKDEFVKNWGLCITASFVEFLVIGLFEPVFFHMGEVVLYTICAMATIVWRIKRNMD